MAGGGGEGYNLDKSILPTSYPQDNAAFNFDLSIDHAKELSG